MDGASGVPLASSIIKRFFIGSSREKPTLSVNQNANPAPGFNVPATVSKKSITSTNM
jgi:hypothetical protein